MFAMDADDLTRLGLTKNESEIYLLLLESGPARAGELARKTKVSRPHVYDVLEILVSKGLASYVIKENRRYYCASEPDALLRLLEEKRQQLEQEEAYAKKILSELDKLRKPPEEEVAVEIYRGIEGLKTVFEDILRVGKDWKTIGYTGKTPELAPVWWENIQRRRIAMKIKREIIAPYEMKGHFDLSRPLDTAYFLPKGYSLPISLILYGNNLIYYIPLKNDFIGIRIIGKKIRAIYDNYFQLLKKLAKS